MTVLPMAPVHEEPGGERQCRDIPSTELVVVGLQQGLGIVTRLTAGQVLAGALLLRLAAAAASTTSQVGVVLRGRSPAMGKMDDVTSRPSWPFVSHTDQGTHLCSGARLGLHLQEGADVLEGGSAGGLQGPASLHDAVPVTVTGWRPL